MLCTLQSLETALFQLMRPTGLYCITVLLTTDMFCVCYVYSAFHNGVYFVCYIKERNVFVKPLPTLKVIITDPSVGCPMKLGTVKKKKACQLLSLNKKACEQ